MIVSPTFNGDTCGSKKQNKTKQKNRQLSCGGEILILMFYLPISRGVANIAIPWSSSNTNIIILIRQMSCSSSYCCSSWGPSKAERLIFLYILLELLPREKEMLFCPLFKMEKKFISNIGNIFCSWLKVLKFLFSILSFLSFILLNFCCCSCVVLKTSWPSWTIIITTSILSNFDIPFSCALCKFDSHSKLSKKTLMLKQ